MTVRIGRRTGAGWRGSRAASLRCRGGRLITLWGGVLHASESESLDPAVLVGPPVGPGRPVVGPAGRQSEAIGLAVR